MTAEQFAYWMQGFAELTGDEMPTPAQWKSIRDHLQTVFVKVTPSLEDYRIPINDPAKIVKRRAIGWPRVGTPLDPLIAACKSQESESFC